MPDQTDPKDHQLERQASSKPSPDREQNRGRRERVDIARDRRENKQQLKRWLRDFNLEEDDDDWDDGWDE